jgi:hypothetical protein
LSQARFRINTENVVHETVDGEVIAIDLANGSYYSLAGCGPEIWTLLLGGAGEAEICGALASSFDAEPEAIRSEVAALIVKLQEAGLVVVDGESADSDVVAPNGTVPRTPFEPPRFERYNDMKDYFLLDPIHEVDPAGWPRPAA